MNSDFAETSVEGLQPDGFIIGPDGQENVELCIQEGDSWVFLPAHPFANPILKDADAFN